MPHKEQKIKQERKLIPLHILRIYDSTDNEPGMDESELIAASLDSKLINQMGQVHSSRIAKSYQIIKIPIFKDLNDFRTFLEDEEVRNLFSNGLPIGLKEKIKRYVEKYGKLPE